MYLKLISINQVQVSVIIADSMDANKRIICKMNGGDTVIARAPAKFYISFVSEAKDGSKFFLSSYYSE